MATAALANLTKINLYAQGPTQFEKFSDKTQKVKKQIKIMIALQVVLTIVGIMAVKKLMKSLSNQVIAIYNESEESQTDGLSEAQIKMMAEQFINSMMMAMIIASVCFLACCCYGCFAVVGKFDKYQKETESAVFDVEASPSTPVQIVGQSQPIMVQVVGQAQPMAHQQ
jgi:hypothetical protein